jgi:glyoxylase-like metal-dependent hydrolase (beta-lactamase superfamily II)
VDVHTLDLQFLGLPHVIASYLVVGPGGPVLVESGPGSTLDGLRAGLAAHGYQPADIRHVLLTHIHLDHAGAAGWWARQGAHIYVHHLGAPHLVDPSKLLSSAARIYGPQMEYLWGDVLPVPADCLTALYDGDEVRACGLTFTALDTPGHARHHHAFRIEDVAFAGDVAGIHLPGSRLVSVPTPPPEFDREAWHLSLKRLAAEKLAAVYPTHFGAVTGVPEYLEELDRLVDEAAGFVRARMDAGDSREELIAAYTAWDRARADAWAVSDDEFQAYSATNPHFMSVDGLMRYWRKRLEAENPPS